MGADDIAVLRARHRTNDGPAFTRAGCAPADREFKFGTRRGVRGYPNMVNPIGTSHRNGPQNGDGPPEQTGLITKHEN